jgi:hypothetical protein
MNSTLRPVIFAGVLALAFARAAATPLAADGTVTLKRIASAGVQELTIVFGRDTIGVCAGSQSR